jgi:hypothetical protein
MPRYISRPTKIALPKMAATLERNRFVERDVSNRDQPPALIGSRSRFMVNSILSDCRLHSQFSGGVVSLGELLADEQVSRHRAIKAPRVTGGKRHF